MNKRNLLINEPPLQVLPSLAKEIGLNEAIALQQLHYWAENPKVGKEIDGYKWVYNNYEEWREDNFPFWSIRTIQRIFKNLEEMGLIVSMQNASYDRTKYYRVHYDKLSSWSATDWHNPEFQDGAMDDDKVAPSLTETTTETTTKKTKKKGDLVDAMLFYGKQSRRDDAVNELFDKLERELKVNLQRSNSNQVIVRKILKADADGEKVDTFLAWLKSDEWRLAHLYIYTDLSKLWQMYPQAFANEPSTSRPEYPPIRDLSIGAVPNPFQKPKSLPRTGREQS